MTGVIYKLEFASGKSYIGLTSQPLVNRIRGHRHDALRRQSTLPVHKAWRVHGEPMVSTLLVAPKELLGLYETIAIKALGTMKPGGYNLSPGGEVPPATIPGVAAKISAAAKARGMTAEHKRAMADGVRRAMRDPEVRQRMSDGQKGRTTTEETRAKQRAAMLGRKLSDEHKAKLKEARNARPPATSETRSKMSASHKIRRARTVASATISTVSFA